MRNSNTGMARGASRALAAPALALACAIGAIGALGVTQARAAAIDFEAAAPRFMFDGDEFEQGGYLFDSAFIGDVDHAGGLVGAVVDGADAGLCVAMSCPANNLTHYLAALDDGMVIMQRSDGAPFRLAGFDASSIGSSLLGDPPISEVMLVTGFRADGSYTGEYYALVTPSTGFQRFVPSAAFGANAFVALSFYSYNCDYAGECKAFGSNKAQFGLDNILATAVPEPSAVQMLLLGLAGLSGMAGMTARRRRQVRAGGSRP